MKKKLIYIIPILIIVIVTTLLKTNPTKDKFEEDIVKKIIPAYGHKITSSGLEKNFYLFSTYYIVFEHISTSGPKHYITYQGDTTNYIEKQIREGADYSVFTIEISFFGIMNRFIQK